MDITQFDNKTNQPLVVALGFFDCVHMGHRALLSAVNQLAKSTGALSAVFTFNNNPALVYCKKNATQRKLIYDFNHRCDIFKREGVDIVLYETFDKDFCDIEADDFLTRLFNHNIIGVVCGEDYSFGKNANGNATKLKQECDKRGVPLQILSQVYFEDKKVSSTLIYKAIESGDINKANKMLFEPYTYSGKVVKGYGIGKTIGFPTANIAIDKDIILPKDGVYVARCVVFGTMYKAIVNVGTRPTFGDSNKSMEVNLIDFDADLYDKTINVQFLRYLRPQIAFSTPQQLSNQLTKDLLEAKK